MEAALADINKAIALCTSDPADEDAAVLIAEHQRISREICLVGPRAEGESLEGRKVEQSLAARPLRVPGEGE